MKEPTWIDLADCLTFHDDMLARFGGLPGVRVEKLDSALQRPRRLFECGRPGPFELAAAYAAGIVHDRPFPDGNKRAGFMAAALHLEINGLSFAASEDEVVVQTLGLAAGKIDEQAYARWLAGGVRTA